MPKASVPLMCPCCASSLNPAGREPLRCAVCGQDYSIIDGVRVLLAERVQLPAQKKRQAMWFDGEADTEWEIDRPHGAPAFHRWLIDEKFRRSVSGLNGLPSMSVLTVCGGSGMDAEMLVHTGANVVSVDISLGAAYRAVERARRHDVAITAIVADAEQLPFADRSFDLVYVHDGLHHLEHPEVGLSEMVRVARRAVSITEPADAALTRVAVRAGAAEDIEEAGNRVARLRLAEVVSMLERADFSVVNAERYAMFYRHQPGWAARLLSHPPLLPLAKGAIRAGNVVLGGLGNKLVVVAVRD